MTAEVIEEPTPAAPAASRAAIAVLLVLVALVMAGSGIIAPVLPLYGAQFSSSAALVGMLITIFGITRFAANFPSGLLYDRVGSRTLLVVGSALLLAGGVGAALATDLGWLLAWRAVQGVGSGVFLTTVGVLVGRLSQPGTRGRFLANYQTAVFVGAGFGPVLGGYIAQLFGITAPFWAYALIALACLVVAIAFSQREPAPVSVAGSLRPRIGPVLRQPQFVANLAMSFSLGFVRTAALWQLIPIIAADRFAMDFGLIGIAISATSLSTLVILPVAGRMVDRFGWHLLPALSALLLTAALALVAVSASEVLFWIGVSLIGLASGLLGPATATALVDVTPTELLGGATGFQRMIGDAGFVLGPLVVGGLVDARLLDQAGGMLLCAVLVLASGALWFVTTRVGRRVRLEPTW